MLLASKRGKHGSKTARCCSQAEVVARTGTPTVGSRTLSSVALGQQSPLSPNETSAMPFTGPLSRGLGRTTAPPAPRWRAAGPLQPPIYDSRRENLDIYIGLQTFCSWSEVLLRQDGGWAVGCHALLLEETSQAPEAISI
ncbi:unnamed protein product [Prorocentrum cordatum]|uniref:Uncharacterized protein n=1 Tax=Prorocentrum cordatum TaxID=2364126 RepID=A0ABN9VG89_9DINO|nr:unnamed protein product [Polarella glacialis]